MPYCGPDLQALELSPGEPPAEVIVLGVGNVLLSDDGVGVRVLRALEQARPSSRVRFVDGGTLGFMLAAEIDGADALLVLDAVQMHRPPGTVQCFEGEAMDRFLTGGCASVHEIGIRDLFDLARLTGTLPHRRALIGIQPASTSLGESLSAGVGQAVGPAAARAEELVSRWLAELGGGE